MRLWVIGQQGATQPAPNVRSVGSLAAQAAFLAVDPPPEAWEFQQAMAYAMDSGIELCLAFVARADEDVIADKWAAVSEYSKEAAETSKTLTQRCARWMVD